MDVLSLSVYVYYGYTCEGDGGTPNSLPVVDSLLLSVLQILFSIRKDYWGMHDGLTRVDGARRPW